MEVFSHSQLRRPSSEPLVIHVSNNTTNGSAESRFGQRRNGHAPFSLASTATIHEPGNASQYAANRIAAAGILNLHLNHPTSQITTGNTR